MTMFEKLVIYLLWRIAFGAPISAAAVDRDQRWKAKVRDLLDQD